MEGNWRESLREAMPEGGAPAFRHELSIISASDIAQQFYCEAKIENEYTLGEVPTESKSIGTELHDQIFAIEGTEQEELIRHISERPTLTASFLLHAKIGSIQVAGLPDAVIFEHGRPRWIIELKTTRGDIARLWADQEIQLRIYGLLMEQMGFDCSTLALALVRAKQDETRPLPVKELLLPLIRGALSSEKTPQLERALPLKFFLLRHEPSKAVSAVLWAQEYWLKNREAIPTTSMGKCRGCEFKASCNHSLVKTGPT